MYSLYTTKEILEKILLNQYSNKWSCIVKGPEIKHFYIPDTYSQDDECVSSMGYEDPLSELTKIDVGCIKSSSKYEKCLKEQCYTNYETEFPNDAYPICILNSSIFSEEDTKKIERDLGIFCQSEMNESGGRLLEPALLYSLESKETDGNWTSFFKRFSHIPSLDIVICDRYFFSDISGDKLVGLGNLKEIIEEIVQKGCKKDFSIIVFFEKNQIGKNKSNGFISGKEKEIVNELQRFIKNKAVVPESERVKITIELYLLPPNNGNRDITHDRVLVTEYYMIDASHALASFFNNKNQIAQVFHYNAIFSSVDGDGKSDVIKYRNMLLDGYAKILLNNSVEMYRITYDKDVEHNTQKGYNGYNKLFETSYKKMSSINI